MARPFGFHRPGSSDETTPCVSLERRLGVVDAAAIVIANVIGVGIFTTPGIVAAQVPHPLGLLAVWALGGLLAFAGAMAYAELAVRYPRAGGEYVYLRESYGPLMAFLTGWTSFVAGFSGAIAAAAVACAAFLSRFVPVIGETRPLFALPFGIASVTTQSLVAIGIIVAVSLIHIRGVGVGKLLQNTCTAIKLLALVALIVIGLTMGDGSIAHFASNAPVTGRGWTSALIPVMFSYSGWNAATYVAEEIRDPARNVPRALGFGTVIVALIYLGLNIVYMFALPITAMGDVRVGQLATERLLGTGAAGILGIVTIIIVLGSISAMVVTGPRVYYAMARDGLFLAPAARVHPRFRTPHIAIAAQAVWSSILVLSGTFDQLLMYTGFAVLLFTAITVASLFVARRACPNRPRFSAWGYPFAPALLCGTCLVIVVNAMIEQPGVSLVGLGIISAGIPIFWWVTRRRQPALIPTGLIPDEKLSAP